MLRRQLQTYKLLFSSFSGIAPGLATGLADASKKSLRIIGEMLLPNAYLCVILCKNGKGKGFPHSLLSLGPGAYPGVQAVSQQVTVSHPPGGRLPLLSARPAVTFPAAEHYRPLAGTKLYCLVTEAHRCE